MSFSDTLLFDWGTEIGITLTGNTLANPCSISVRDRLKESLFSNFHRFFSALKVKPVHYCDYIRPQTVATEIEVNKVKSHAKRTKQVLFYLVQNQYLIHKLKNLTKYIYA